MCNVIGADGESRRNHGRDELNKKLRSYGHVVFDPQIDETSHGRPYDYAIDGPAEQLARAKAYVHVYQLGSETFGGVTMLEIMRDVSLGKQVVLWLTGAVNEKNRPVFEPAGWDEESIGGAATRAHAKQMLKQGSSMRANLIDFTAGAKNLKVVRTIEEVEEALRSFGVKI